MRTARSRATLRTYRRIGVHGQTRMDTHDLIACMQDATGCKLANLASDPRPCAMYTLAMLKSAVATAGCSGLRRSSQLQRRSRGVAEKFGCSGALRRVCLPVRALVDGQSALEQSQRLRVLVCLVVQRAHVEARHCHVRVVAAEYDKRRMEFIGRRGLRMHCRALDRHSIGGSTVAGCCILLYLPMRSSLMRSERW